METSLRCLADTPDERLEIPGEVRASASQCLLFPDEMSTQERLDSDHYLGNHGARARLIYNDEHGAIVFSSPSSRRLPSGWLELSRWCLMEGAIGSKQWAACLAWLADKTTATTIVSYSDPSVGHDGALYRACGWWWAPTWHALREPPTGSGIRGGKLQRAKHRWVYLLSRDDEREQILKLKDAAVERRFPFASYSEPRWKRGRPVRAGMDRYRRWSEAQ
jgi:hypothetical protein